jgi:hypothetical protein
MRLVMIALALLAGLKVWNSERLYRTATEEVIVAAFRDRATLACQKDAARELAMVAATAPALWARPASIELVIGKPRLDVALWDVDNPKWAARYKHPFLLLRSSDRASTAVCAYDVRAGQAEIEPL